MTFGSEHEHRDHRIFWVHNDVDLLPVVSYHIESEYLSILSLMLHQHLQKNYKFV